MTFAAVAAGQLIGWSIAVGIYLLLTREPKPEPRKPRGAQVGPVGLPGHTLSTSLGMEPPYRRILDNLRYGEWVPKRQGRCQSGAYYGQDAATGRQS